LAPEAPFYARCLVFGVNLACMWMSGGDECTTNYQPLHIIQSNVDTAMHAMNVMIMLTVHTIGMVYLLFLQAKDGVKWSLASRTLCWGQQQLCY